MNLKTRVKVSQITNLSDARYCAGMGVDMLGFTLSEKESTFIDLKNYQNITEWVAGPKLVGEFTDESFEEIAEKTKEYIVDLIQVSSLNEIKRLSGLNLPLIVKASASEFLHADFQKDLPTIREHVSCFSVEDQRDVDLETEEHILELSHQLNLMIGFNVTEAAVTKFLNYPIEGLTLFGSSEDKPGFKDYDQLADIFDILEKEE